MSLLFQVGSTEPILQTEDQGRPKAAETPRQGSTAEADAPPEWNETVTDSSSEVDGHLRSRAVTGDWHESERGPAVPFTPQIAFNAPVDSQVSTAGTASAREESGDWGHGTMQYANTMEPVIRPGIAFGTEQFRSTPFEIQENMSNTMTPYESDADRMARSGYAAAAIQNAALARQASLLGDWAMNR